jgi:putative pyruvate formate lyase activating enzyme
MDKKADKGFVAAYLKLSGEALKEKIHNAEEILKNCTLCPRSCAVDRTSGEVGFCRTDNIPYISSWNPHFGEEAPLVGHHGSGTIFMTHCSLGCLFCQNWTISHMDEGYQLCHPYPPGPHDLKVP